VGAHRGTLASARRRKAAGRRRSDAAVAQRWTVAVAVSTCSTGRCRAKVSLGQLLRERTVVALTEDGEESSGAAVIRLVSACSGTGGWTRRSRGEGGSTARGPGGDGVPRGEKGRGASAWWLTILKGVAMWISWGWGGGPGLCHAARRWGRVPTQPAGGGRPATARPWHSRAARGWAEPNSGGRGCCQVGPVTVMGGGVKRFKPFPKFKWFKTFIFFEL
jgi:hypothetical protein